MNKVNGNNRFCGPSVLSAIAGITTDEAEKIIQDITKQNGGVRGVYMRDLKTAFNQLGFKTIDVPAQSRTIFSSMFGLADGVYVFMVPGHYIAIESHRNSKFICDNHTKEPINVASSARLGMKVISVFRVEKV